MVTPPPPDIRYLEQLLDWWRGELDASREQQRAERVHRPWAERLAGGLALTALTFARREQQRGGDVVLWFRLQNRQPLPRHRLKPGYPAVLWPAGSAEAADGERWQRGTLRRITATEVGLCFPRDYDRFIERGELDLEREDSEVTFQRGEAATRAFVASDGPRALFFGDALPRWEKARKLTLKDGELDVSQRQAVERAVRARDAALVFGPPGTGKTRVLVEIVRQSLLLRRRILVTAASNIAVDNITRRLAATGVKVLRLGPANAVAADLSESTFQHQLSKQAEAAEAQQLFDQARDLAAGTKRVAPKRIGELRRQAHTLRNLARANVMRRARVVCATAGGVDAVPLGDDKFDLVVLDEATQAPDPVALAALDRGGVLVLAGDPQQLPPTVVTRDPEAKAGLSSTLFERCAARWPAEATSMLTTQYRMSAELMQFPSRAHYDGRLEAAASNRAHRLQDIVEATLSERDARPWLFLDTSDIGAQETLDERSRSFFNDSHRALVAREIHRLCAQGVAPNDIAAICPYSAQTWRLRRELAALIDAGLEVGTVDGFQGREKEVVVVDLLRSNPSGDLGFLHDVRRTNVAITRARRQLIVIANGTTIATDAYYARLLAAAQSCGAWEPADL